MLPFFMPRPWPPSFSSPYTSPFLLPSSFFLFFCVPSSKSGQVWTSLFSTSYSSPSILGEFSLVVLIPKSFKFLSLVRTPISSPVYSHIPNCLLIFPFGCLYLNLSKTNWIFAFLPYFGAFSLLPSPTNDVTFLPVTWAWKLTSAFKCSLSSPVIQ